MHTYSLYLLKISQKWVVIMASLICKVRNEKAYSRIVLFSNYQNLALQEYSLAMHAFSNIYHQPLFYLSLPGTNMGQSWPVVLSLRTSRQNLCPWNPEDADSMQSEVLCSILCMYWSMPASWDHRWWGLLQVQQYKPDRHRPSFRLFESLGMPNCNVTIWNAPWYILEI